MNLSAIKNYVTNSASYVYNNLPSRDAVKTTALTALKTLGSMLQQATSSIRSGLSWSANKVSVAFNQRISSAVAFIFERLND